jgi:hypothetical protein
MIVYGDLRREAPTAALLEELRAGCRALEGAAAEERPDAATRLLIDSGTIAQGALDAAFAIRGADDWGELEEVCGRLLLAAGNLLFSKEPGRPDFSSFRESLHRLGGLPLPGSLTVNTPEGYAFYALDPELYARAAREVAGATWVVIGLRSIGTGLAGVVAAALGAIHPAVTLRPVGHPFRREVRVAPRLERMLLARTDARFAVVDEGPGLSGSSFGAVADWLEDRGVAPERVAFFPGHRGDLGPQGAARHRDRWRHATRHVADFDQFFAEGEGWFEPGVPNAALGAEDLAGGRWRARLYASEGEWPPANPAQERRKYLYEAGGRKWLAKFAGYGRMGEAKLALARRLSDARFIPPLRELRRGFLVGEWVEARPLVSVSDFDRCALVVRFAEYLDFRAREFPAGPSAPGADAEALFQMARVNVAERFGDEMAVRFDSWRDRLPEVARRVRRAVTDNRMHAWVWLLLPDGRILKADALDHHAAHDCIGAQDIAWDVVGAVVEWNLSPAEQERLERRLEPRPDPLVTDFYRLCYPAFQMGYYAMAADAQPDEAAGLRAAAERHAAQLARLLERQ